MKVLESLEAEKARLAAAVAEAEAVLQQRRDELFRFQNEAASVLGLGKKTDNAPFRAAYIRRKKVREVFLSADGNLSASEIAEKLDMDIRVVELDLRWLDGMGKIKLRTSGEDDKEEAAADEEPTSAEQPSRRIRLNVMHMGETVQECICRLIKEEHLTVDQVVEKLDMSRASVGQHVSLLRRKGRLPSAEPVAMEKPPERQVSSAPPFNAGDMIETLRLDVARQCRESGNRVGPAFLEATMGGQKRHTHRIRVDRMGDGTTETDDTGHVHRVYRFVVSMADSHQHAVATYK